MPCRRLRNTPLSLPVPRPLLRNQVASLRNHPSEPRYRYYYAFVRPPADSHTVAGMCVSQQRLPLQRGAAPTLLTLTRLKVWHTSQVWGGPLIICCPQYHCCHSCPSEPGSINTSPCTSSREGAEGAAHPACLALVRPFQHFYVSTVSMGLGMPCGAKLTLQLSLTLIPPVRFNQDTIPPVLLPLVHPQEPGGSLT